MGEICLRVVVLGFVPDGLFRSDPLEYLFRRGDGAKGGGAVSKGSFHSRVLEASASGVVAINLSGKIAIFNQAAERMLGLRKEKVLGRPIGILEPFAELWDVLEKGESKLNSRVRVGFSTFMVSMTPVQEDGKRVGAVAVFQDVTELCKMASE